MDRYKIIPEEEYTLFNRQLVDVADYSKRRELKINQYKKEKELRARIEVKISCWSLPTLRLTCVRIENSQGEGTNLSIGRHFNWLRSPVFSPTFSFINPKWSRRTRLGSRRDPPRNNSSSPPSIIHSIKYTATKYETRTRTSPKCSS